ncbi:uncharacterized protein [Penaeus vannamei]|uniref:uncharacterized protein n=1 Tax=Penaeus vannamei TaxID=6689 RepID=UPI00387F8296
MTNPSTCLLVLLLLSLASVRGEENGLQETGRTILSPYEAAGMHVVVSQFFSGGGLLLACFYVFLQLFKPLYTLFTEPSEGGSHGHGTDTQAAADAHGATDTQAAADAHGATDTQAAAETGGGHRSFLNNIDLVDVTFNAMNVEDAECRRRVVCEIQRAASTMPLLGELLESASSSINGLENYRNAQQLGAALEDCQLLFHCPHPPLGFS